MFDALDKAIRQLSDPAIKRILKFGILAALLVFFGLLALAWLGIGALNAMVGGADAGWFASTVDWVLTVLGGGAAVLIALMLFPTVVMTVTGLFAEDVAKAVEARHYPDLPAPRAEPLFDAMIGGMRFAGKAVLLNLLALPLYLILPGLNFLIYYTLNGYLLGREFHETVALRRLDRVEVRAHWTRYRIRLIVAGMMITFGMTIPVVNLVVPVVAIAMMLHLFQSLRSSRQG